MPNMQIDPPGHGPCRDGSHTAWGQVACRTDELERGLLRAVEHFGRLESAGRYHLLGGGKRLRGRLALASGIALDCPAPHALSMAVAVELLHNASLVHDDLQDRDEQRRGRPAVWSKYGDPAALLLGDALLAEAFAVLAEISSPRTAAMVRSLSSCVSSLASGQCSDGADAAPLDRTASVYETLARAKTGALFALPPALVCIHVLGSEAPVADATESFSLLGVAFQIFDDIADLTASKGRPVGSDLRCNRMSAAILHALPPTGSASVGVHELSMEDRAAQLLRSPGIRNALAHQDSVLRRARQAAAPLPSNLRGVLDDVALDVSAATRRLIPSAEDGSSAKGRKGRRAAPLRDGALQG